ncbi:cupin domain-containing protein [Micromonospora sp. CPCC 205371]|nr:cupin domain-containing protein [Micromonospora sp. CPCC 205371]
MEIRNFDAARLASGYGIEYEMLLPWPPVNAPFAGAWCTVPPGGASAAHEHHEYEIFIGISGQAELVGGERRSPFGAGDIAHLPPHLNHQVINQGDAPFTYYAVWWDADMSDRFLARHRTGTR